MHWFFGLRHEPLKGYRIHAAFASVQWCFYHKKKKSSLLKVLLIEHSMTASIAASIAASVLSQKSTTIRTE
jgi:hypothetical protein